MATVLHARDTSLQSVLPRSIRNTKLFQQTTAPWVSGLAVTAAVDPPVVAINKTLETTVLSPANSYVGVIKAIPNTTNTQHIVTVGNTSIPSGTHTFEAYVYIKAVSGAYDIALQVTDNVASAATTWFDTNGVLKPAGNSAGTGYANLQRGSFNMGNGWVKLTVLGNYTRQASVVNFGINLYIGNGSMGTTFTGNGTDGFYIYAPFLSATTQPDEVLGDQWLNTTTKSLRVWSGYDWLETGSGQAQVGVNLYDASGNLITTEIRNSQVSINPNGTLSGAGSGQANLSNLPGTVSNSQIADLAAAKLTGQITETQISDSAISTPKLAAGSVLADKLAAGSVIADKIAAGSITTSKLRVVANSNALNLDPNTQDVSSWTGGTFSVSTDTTSSTGRALEITSSGVTTVESQYYPIDTTRNYLLRMSAKQISGSSTCYLGVEFITSSLTTINSATAVGWPSGGTYLYFGLTGTTPPSSWTQYSIAFGPSETAKIPSDAKYFRVVILGNYTGGAGVQRFSNIRLTEKTGADLVVEGAISASKIAANTITADKLQAGILSADNVLTRGLTVRDNAGNIILSAGQPLSSGNITPDSGWLNSNITISGGALTGIGSGAGTVVDNGKAGGDSLIPDPQFLSPGYWLGDWDGNPTITNFSSINASRWVGNYAGSPGVALQCGAWGQVGDQRGGRIMVQRGKYRLRLRVFKDPVAAGNFWAGLHIPGQAWWTSPPVNGGQAPQSSIPENGWNLAAIPGNAWTDYVTVVDIVGVDALQVQPRIRNGLTGGNVWFTMEFARVPDLGGTGEIAGQINSSNVGTFVNTDAGLSNSQIGINASGQFYGGGAGTGITVSNNQISVSGGVINGIGTGNGTAVANSAISISNTGALQGAGGGQVTTLPAVDTRNDNQLPNWTGYPMGLTEEFKLRTAIGAPGTATYGVLRTEKPWTDSSGGAVVQTFKSADGEWKRTSNSGWTGWNAWAPKLDRQIDGSNVSTYIANAAIQDAQIGNLSAGKITAGTIDAARIGAGSIDATKISVSQLSAITANIGTLRTAPSGQRTEIRDNVIQVYDSFGTTRVKIGGLSL